MNPEKRPENINERLEENTKIVESNFNMLKKDMIKLLGEESIGGNAGNIKIDGKECPCGATNGFADPATGRIVAFGNFQDLDKEIVKQNAEFTLIIAFRFPLLIVDFIGKEKFPLEGKENIEKAIERFNRHLDEDFGKKDSNDNNEGEDLDYMRGAIL